MKTIISILAITATLISCNSKIEKANNKVEYQHENGQKVNSLSVAAKLNSKGRLYIKDLKTGAITKADSTLFVGVDANGFTHFPDGHKEAPASY